MLLKMYQAGQPVLRQKAKVVSKAALAKPHTQALIDAMIATLRDCPGVGLAAPQVGEPLQIVVVEDRAEYHQQVPPALLRAQARKPVALHVLVNPVLAVTDAAEAVFFEGCLSVEGYVAAVPRAKQVCVTALDRQGNPITFIAKGWYARILQHEVGHLNGELYIDRMLPTSFMNHKNFSKLWRNASQASITRTFMQTGRAPAPRHIPKTRKGV